MAIWSISIHCVQLCKYVHFVYYKTIVKSCILSPTSQLVVVLLNLKVVFCESLVFDLCLKTLSKEIFCKAEGRFK